MSSHMTPDPAYLNNRIEKFDDRVGELASGETMTSSTALCWLCRLDPIEPVTWDLQHGEFRFLCRKCREVCKVFGHYIARLHEVSDGLGLDELMRVIGLERFAMRLEVAHMRERVRELTAAAHQAAAYMNGIPPARYNAFDPARVGREAGADDEPEGIDIPISVQHIPPALERRTRGPTVRVVKKGVQ